MPALVYCGNGNPRIAKTAVDAGYRYGCQLPGSVSPDWPMFFADQDWKKPDRAAYMVGLSTHRPVMASVLDWEREEQLPEVLSWAEEAAQWVRESIVVIPKIIGSIDRIPRTIGGKRVVLGYSVPSKFGATSVPFWEFAGWPVHLLGGSPHRQMQEWAYMSCTSDIVSADGNMAWKMASQFCRFWVDGRWVPLTGYGKDAPYACFEISCRNIFEAWGSRKR